MKKHPYTSIHEFWAGIDRICTTTHCGYIGRYPENSIFGLQAAVELGSDFIEFDLRATADNEIVLLHDATLDRNSNGSGPVNQFTLKELQQFNFSYFEYFIDCSGRKLNSPRMESCPITTFQTVLEKLRGEAFMNIQVYATEAAGLQKICGMFKDFNMYDQAYLSVLNYDEAQRIRNIDPEIELCVLNRPAPTTIAALHTMKDFGCKVAQPLWTDITPEYCQVSRELGIFSNVYYANLPRDIRRYAEMGIQGILSDYTENLIDFIEGR